MNQVTGTGPYTFFQIGVNGDGYYFFQLTLLNNEVITQYREVTTDLTVGLGWNYVAFNLDEIYEYSYVTMYNRYDGMTLQSTSSKPAYGYYHRKYQTYFAGEYDETRIAWTAANSKLAIVFGCAIKYDFSNYPTTVVDTVPYGFCMRGWMQYVEAEVAYGREGYISYYDTDTEVQNEHNCAGNKFCNPNLATSLTYSTITITDTKLFYWDSAITNINNQNVDSDWSCTVGLTVGNTYNPFWQPKIGRITSNETNYFRCNIKRTNVNTYRSFLAQMFTMEAWFRFDPIDRRPDGFISQIFSLYDSSTSNYYLGFAASNTFLRIYLNSKIQDIHYLFNETTDYWHYIAVSYVRDFEHEAYIYVFMDSYLLLETAIFDWFVFSYSSTNYWLIIGKDFPGIVRRTKINAIPYTTGSSQWINTVASNCIGQGSLKCSFCDIDELVGATTYNCFPTCDNFGYYFPTLGGTCKKCFKSCRYCYDSSASTNCFLCNQTANWTEDTSAGFTSFNPQGGNTIQCTCSGGTYISDARNLCLPCDSSCLTCSTAGSSNCDSCRNGFYKMFEATCVRKCPSSLYIKDDQNHICDIKDPCLSRAERPNDNDRDKNCIPGQYYDYGKKGCYKCSSDCATCEVNSTRCTSCACGQYLQIDNSCSLCNTAFSNSMISTSQGGCLEQCGDGKNLGLYACDDGNNEDGDGCSSNCMIEDNYICRGGYEGNKDNCTYIKTELKSVTIDSNNNILIQFTRPITINNTQNSGLDISVTTKDGVSKRITWYIYKTTPFPTSYLFIIVEIKDEILGGGYQDNQIKVKYKGSGSGRLLYQQSGQIYDENGKEIKIGTYSTAYVNTNNPISQQDKDNAELYGKITLGFIAATISFWLVISFITEKTSLPCVLIFMTFQAIFYYSLQDMYLDKRTIHYFEHFRIFRIEHDRIKNYFIETKLFDISKINKYIFNKDIYYIGEIFYNCFLVNNQLKIFILTVYFGFLPFITSLNFMLLHCTKYRCAWFNRNFGSKYFFGGTFLFFILFALPFGFTSLLEITKTNKDNLYQIYSLFLSIVFLAVLFVILITIWILVIYNFNHSMHPLLQERFSFIFKPVKNKGIYVVAMPLYYTQRFLQFVFQASLAKSTLGPLITQTFISFFAFSYFLFLRPFKSVTNNFLAVFLEIPQITFGLYGLIFSEPDHQYRAYGFSFYVATHLAVICVACLFLLIMSWFYLIEFFYKFRFGVKPDIMSNNKLKKKPAPRKQVIKPMELTHHEKRFLDTQQSVNEMRFKSTLRDDFNDTSKPVNIIPEFKDLQRKKIVELEEEKKLKDEVQVKKLTDHEEMKDTIMGQYDQKKEKQVNLVNPSTKKRILVKRKKGQPKLLKQDDHDNLEVAVIPIPGANLQSKPASKAGTRAGSRAQTKRDQVPPSFGRTIDDGDRDQNSDFNQ